MVTKLTTLMITVSIHQPKWTLEEEQTHYQEDTIETMLGCHRITCLILKKMLKINTTN